MKKLLLLFAFVSFAACSSDDNGGSDDPQVVINTYDYTVFENAPQGKRMSYIAIVENESDESLSGKVVFKIQHNNATVYEYINNVSLLPNQVKTAEGNGSIYFPSETLNVLDVYFEEN